MTETLQKVGTEVIYFHIIKVACDKPTANIIFKGRNVAAFPLRSGTSQGRPGSPLLFNIALEVLDTAVVKIKSTQT